MNTAVENICIEAEFFTATLQQSCLETEPASADTCFASVALEGASKISNVVESEGMGHSSSNEEALAGNGDACHVPCILVAQSHTYTGLVLPTQPCSLSTSCTESCLYRTSGAYSTTHYCAPCFLR